MKLESLLKPFKWMDEQVLRQYTKVGKKWEDKGRNIKTLSIPLSVVGTGFYLASQEFLPIYGWFSGTDLARSLLEKQDTVISETKTIDNPILATYRRFHKIGRLPYFAMGITLTSKALIDLYQRDFSAESLVHLEHGLSALFATSSVYLKDRDPKLLDKASAFDKISSWMKEKLSPPKPVLEPIPLKY